MQRCMVLGREIDNLIDHGRLFWVCRLSVLPLLRSVAMRMPRCSLLCRWAGPGLAASALMLAAVQIASAQTPTTLRVSTIPTIDVAAFEVALAKGLFEAEGLKIDTTPTVGGAVGIPALVSGQLQAAASNVVTIILAA